MALPIIVFAGVAVIVLGAWALMSRRQSEAWEEFAKEVGADFMKGGFLRASKVQMRIGGSTVTLDTYSVPSGDSNTTYTRFRTVLQQARAGLQFAVSRRNWVSKLDKALGTKEIEVGDPEFSHEFIIIGNDAAQVQALLASQRLRQLIQGQKSMKLGVKDNALLLEVQGAIRDVERLRSLFEVYKEMLYQLDGQRLPLEAAPA